MPLLAVHIGESLLALQFTLLQIRNVLPDKQKPDSLPVLSLKAHGNQVFPVLLSVPCNMTFKGKRILAGKKFPDGACFKGLQETLFFFVVNKFLRKGADNIVV